MQQAHNRCLQLKICSISSQKVRRFPSQPFKDRLHSPGDRNQSLASTEVGSRAGNIVIKTAASYMGTCSPFLLQSHAKGLKRRASIYICGWAKQDIGHAFAIRPGKKGSSPAEAYAFGQHLPDQGKSRWNAGRLRQCRLSRPRPECPCRQSGGHYRQGPHAKARQVVFAWRVHIRHLGRLAAKQRAQPALRQPHGHAFDNSRGHIDIKLAAGKIVQGEKNSGLAPCTRISLTLMATRSMPTVSWRLKAKASFSLVPTPSVAPTRSGLLHARKDQGLNSPPNPRYPKLRRGPLFRPRCGFQPFDKGIAGFNVHSGFSIGVRTRFWHCILLYPLLLARGYFQTKPNNNLHEQICRATGRLSAF